MIASAIIKSGLGVIIQPLFWFLVCQSVLVLLCLSCALTLTGRRGTITILGRPPSWQQCNNRYGITPQSPRVSGVRCKCKVGWWYVVFCAHASKLNPARTNVIGRKSPIAFRHLLAIASRQTPSFNKDLSQQMMTENAIQSLSHEKDYHTE